jgi:diguanylate cyclase (GGDEF)-like protein/PAS domain S-box-containing protein
MTKYDFNFKDIVEAAKDVVIVTRADPLDAPGPEIVYVNKAFTELTGYTAEEVIGKSPRILQSEGTDKSTQHEIRHALDNEQAIRTTIKNYTKTGHEYWLDLSIIPLTDNKGKVTHYAAIERDVSDQKTLEIKLDELAKKDELTGLLNRRAFEQMINQEFLRYLRTHNKFSVLLIDIDNFKSINDKFGHSAGDQALINLAHLFELLFRSYDHAVRLGGDEFCIVLPDSSQVKALIGAERLRHMVEKNPLAIDDDEITMTISIGVAEAQETDLDFHEVLERADKALYKAKHKGRNRVQKFIKEDTE